MEKKFDNKIGRILIAGYYLLFVLVFGSIEQVKMRNNYYKKGKTNSH